MKGMGEKFLIIIEIGFLDFSKFCWFLKRGVDRSLRLVFLEISVLLR